VGVPDAGSLATLLVVLAGLIALAATNGHAASASARPSPFALVYEGVHAPGAGSANLRHEGSFSATAPGCSAGQGVDVQYVHPDGVLREYRCHDGSGSFTAFVGPVFAEHGGGGVWRILGGTGAYRKLRGQGTFDSEFVSGSASDEASIGFRSSWRGLAAFDDVPPEVRVNRSSVTKLRRPKGMYLLRIALSTSDDFVGNGVEYVVLPSSGGSRLAFREGRTTSGKASVSLQVLPPSGERRLLLEVRASDPLGNERRIVRALTLPA
jgi:hypothetical protein